MDMENVPTCTLDFLGVVCACCIRKAHKRISLKGREKQNERSFFSKKIKTNMSMR